MLDYLGISVALQLIPALRSYWASQIISHSVGNDPAEIEVYTGTKHGWCPPDSRVYDAAQADKAWGRMLELFKTSLV